MQYIDFDLDIGPGDGREYPLRVRSQAGETPGKLNLPVDVAKFARSFESLRDAQEVQDLGKQLFELLIDEEVRSRYDVSRYQAREQGLRLLLRIADPELAQLPWEFLYDEREQDFVCFADNTSIVRYLEVAEARDSLAASPPVRVLGMVASPSDLPPLNVAQEQQRVSEALGNLPDVELVWLEGQTWRDLEAAMQQGPWHVFHFIGHGGFDREHEEGYIALVNDDERGESYQLSATLLARVLASHSPLRLVLLNSCQGAQGSRQNLFSSMAATLVRRGLPAVVAMQYVISDRAAIEFSHTFYQKLAEGQSIDTAMLHARRSVSSALGAQRNVEWGVPVLFLRSLDAVLFEGAAQPAKRSVGQKREAAGKPQGKNTTRSLPPQTFRNTGVGSMQMRSAGAAHAAVPALLSGWGLVFWLVWTLGNAFALPLTLFGVGGLAQWFAVRTLLGGSAWQRVSFWLWTLASAIGAWVAMLISLAPAEDPASVDLSAADATLALLVGLGVGLGQWLVLRRAGLGLLALLWVVASLLGALFGGAAGGLLGAGLGYGLLTGPLLIRLLDRNNQ
jgi:CHAT domain-containing protein